MSVILNCSFLRAHGHLFVESTYSYFIENPIDSFASVKKPISFLRLPCRALPSYGIHAKSDGLGGPFIRSACEIGINICTPL